MTMHSNKKKNESAENKEYSIIITFAAESGSIPCIIKVAHDPNMTDAANITVSYNCIRWSNISRSDSLELFNKSVSNERICSSYEYIASAL